MAHTPLRIAAIDAGSNGLRMLIGEVDESGKVVELDDYREPVRLGADAFADGVFKRRTLAAAVSAFEHFKKRMTRYGVRHVRAVATSATREATNGRELVRRIFQYTGIRLQVISGIEEARIVFSALAQQVDLEGKRALLVDMGGGSVELTVAQDGMALGCKTLRLGPVRLMQKLRARGAGEADTPRLLERYRGVVSELLRVELDDEPVDVCVGSGGNIECLAGLRVTALGKVKTGKVKVEDLDRLIEKLEPLTPAQRQEKLGLRPDRADVVVIAAYVLRQLLAEANVRRMLTPKVGLKEGLLRQVATETTR